MFRMLHMLDVHEGHRGLEIGTGTGWNAGLLAHVAGPANVTTVEVDPALAREAGERPRKEGVTAAVVPGDEAEGYADNAPYDRLVATCSVRSVPHPWVDQVKPGGVILTPWESPWVATSWAAVDWDGKSDDRFTVWQHGPRRLWDEVAAAHAWWLLHDRPGPERFGLTVTAKGESAWLDTPDRPVPVAG
ncbi:hypothetical protein GCM10010327_01470 [Streptomyces nitrosporeus]|nr:hypothetical protein GCM10010327_01470 [Streptomyces nitrosporeus]